MAALTQDEVERNPPVTNPTPQRPRTLGVDSGLEALNDGTRADSLALIMVGLPARGKTYIARRVERYLTFFHGCPTRLFNVGDYRREMHGVHMRHDFFDAANTEAQELRFASSQLALEHMKTFLTDSTTQIGRVGVYDATNMTTERRQWILDELKETGIKVVFIESIVTDKTIVDENMMRCLIAPEYKGMEKDDVLFDYSQRLKHYEGVYEPIDAEKESLAFIKLYNGGKHLEIRGIHGYLPTKIVQFLMNVRFTGRSKIFLSRHGQSEYNRLGKIGGDSRLTDMGLQYQGALAEFARTHIATQNGVAVRARLWTSSLQRTIETAALIEHPRTEPNWIQMRPKVWRALDEIYAGVCDGMTYEEIKERYPKEYQSRSANKLSYRYPRGESYLDVIARLEPLVHEMERIKEPLLIVGHQAILRVLYCYFRGLPREQAPISSMPLNTVVELTPDTYTCDEVRHQLLPSVEEPMSH